MNGVGEVFDIGCENLTEGRIVSTVKRCREIKVDGDAVELHCRIALLILKTP